MKKKKISIILIAVILLVISMPLLYIKSKEIKNDKALINIYNNEFMEKVVYEKEFNDSKDKNNNYIALHLDILKVFKESDYDVVIVNEVTEEYSFENGVFDLKSAASGPVEYRFQNNKLSEIVYPEDGAYLSESLKKMARGDYILYHKFDKLIALKSYSKLMESLKTDAENKGLKNFIKTEKDIEKILGETVSFKETRQKKDGTITFVNTKKYDEAKDMVGKENWPHTEAICLHKPTGIAVKTIVDEFPK